MQTSSLIKIRGVERSNHKGSERSSKCVGLGGGRERMLVEAELGKSQWALLFQGGVMPLGPILKSYFCKNGPLAHPWLLEASLYAVYFFKTREEA